MDAVAEGDCELPLGIVWNGEACESMVGCECVGSECDALFDDFDTCEAAYADCGGQGGCAGLELEACEADDLCQVINGQPLVPLGIGGWCTLESEYLGCSSEQGCDDVISFACPEGEDGVFQTIDSCIPDQGFSSCEDPGDNGSYGGCD